MSERTLTDADVQAIVSAFEARMTEKFYRDLGKGMLGLVWKGLLGAMLFVAAYGAYRGNGA
jgi:hypothetical protein